MKFTSKSIRLAIVIAIGLVIPIASLYADQPRMESAIDLLQAAKTSKAPIPLLQKAKEKIQKAAHNKGGRRPDAIEAIKEAIGVAKSGGNPEAKINHAIAMIHSGEDRAK